jgi:hypothetical protein
VDVIASNGNTRGFVGGGSAGGTGQVYEAAGFGQDAFSPSPSTYNINWTVNQYIIFGLKRNSAGNTDTGTCVGYQIYKR